MNKDDYERDLNRRQNEHIQSIVDRRRWQQCMHDACPECIGTGVRRDGSACVHMISCPCPKCSPFSMATG